MLVTNLLTYVLLLVLLTVVPLIPGMVMSRFLSDGLAEQKTVRGAARK
jgi:hypothetical protein